MIEYSKWANLLFESLNLPVKTLYNFYGCTLEVLKNKVSQGMIDEEFYEKLEHYIDSGMGALVKQPVETTLGDQKLVNPMYKQLKIYSDHIFSGNKNKALSYFSSLAKDPDIEIKSLYRYIVQPFQLELGRLWQTSQISVAQEHYATSITQLAMSMLYEKIFSVPKNGKVFLGTCTQGELHEFGIRMICDYMESCGWDTIYLGANMPENSIVQMIIAEEPDIIALSCTMIFNLSKTKSLVSAIKRAGITTPVIVGGYPFMNDEELWLKIGADGYSADFEEAYLLSEKLTLGD